MWLKDNVRINKINSINIYYFSIFSKSFRFEDFQNLKIKDKKVMNFFLNRSLLENWSIKNKNKIIKELKKKLDHSQLKIDFYDKNNNLKFIQYTSFTSRLKYSKGIPLKLYDDQYLAVDRPLIIDKKFKNLDFILENKNWQDLDFNERMQNEISLISDDYFLENMENYGKCLENNPGIKNLHIKDFCYEIFILNVEKLKPCIDIFNCALKIY